MADTARNAALIDNRSGELQRVHDASFAWKAAVGMGLVYPGVRGFWPFSQFDDDMDAMDQTGLAHHLSNDGNVDYGRGATTSMAPWAYFNAGPYLLRATEADLEIQGDETYVNAGNRGLTLFCWVRLDSLTGTQFVIGKWDSVTPSVSYGIMFTAGVFHAYISNTGLAMTHQATSTVSPAVDLWYFVGMTFDPSTSLNVFVGGATEMGTWNSLAAAIPATIFNSTADFTVGAEHGGTNPMGGFVSCALLGVEQYSTLAGTIYRDVLVEAYYHHTRAMYGR